MLSHNGDDLGYLPAKLASFVSALEGNGFKGGICFWRPLSSGRNLGIALAYFLPSSISMIEGVERKKKMKPKSFEFLSLNQMRKKLRS